MYTAARISDLEAKTTIFDNETHELMFIDVEMWRLFRKTMG